MLATLKHDTPQLYCPYARGFVSAVLLVHARARHSVAMAVSDSRFAASLVAVKRSASVEPAIGVVVSLRRHRRPAASPSRMLAYLGACAWHMSARKRWSIRLQPARHVIADTKSNHPRHLCCGAHYLTGHDSVVDAARVCPLSDPCFIPADKCARRMPDLVRRSPCQRPGQDVGRFARSPPVISATSHCATSGDLAIHPADARWPLWA